VRLVWSRLFVHRAATQRGKERMTFKMFGLRSRRRRRRFFILMEIFHLNFSTKTGAGVTYKCTRLC
jgi:hypothetical protein